MFSDRMGTYDVGSADHCSPLVQRKNSAQPLETCRMQMILARKVEGSLEVCRNRLFDDRVNDQVAGSMQSFPPSHYSPLIVILRLLMPRLIAAYRLVLRAHAEAGVAGLSCSR